MAGSGPQLPFLGLEPTGLAAQRALRGGGGGRGRVLLTVASLVMFLCLSCAWGSAFAVLGAGEGGTSPF